LADLTELAKKVYGVKTVFLTDKDCIFGGMRVISLRK